MNKSFKEMLEERRIQGRVEGTTRTTANTTSYPVRAVRIDLSDRETAARLVRNSARRVVLQHKDEIEALAHK